MQADSLSSQTAPTGTHFLPDFCAGPTVLVVLFITEMVAVLLTLAVVEAGSNLYIDLFWLSLYLQWIGLCSTAVLCWLRKQLRGAAGQRVALYAYGALLLVTGLISEGAYRLGETVGLPVALEMSHEEFLVRSLGACAIISALALRYFWVQHQWRSETMATAQARYELLQARIHPHFLFNSLNSIAELTASNPAHAESAIEDLAALFRATLSEPVRQITTLEEELSLCGAYLRMEGLRLGERLRVEWDISPNAKGAQMPPLVLQPLVENAVRHGIECLPEGGTIRIRAKLSRRGQLCEIEIRNPVGELKQAGTGEALNNIRQRLHWLYGAQARLETSAGAQVFTARLSLPAEMPTT